MTTRGLLGQLLKQLQPGTVFIADVYGKHFFIVLNIPEGSGNIPAVMINTNNKSHKYCVPLLQNDYSFLKHDSTCNCDQLHSFDKKAIKGIGKIKTKHLEEIKEKVKLYLSLNKNNNGSV